VKRGENVNVDEFTTAKSKQSKSATNSPAIAQTPTPKPIKSRTPTPKSTKSHKPPPKLLNYPEVLIHQQRLPDDVGQVTGSDNLTSNRAGEVVGEAFRRTDPGSG